ncbi:TrkA C-terminal domain-containing protein [Halosimplex sp. J119]
MSGIDAVLADGATVVAQSGSITERALLAMARVLGYSLIAAGVAAVVAILYRWYVRERVPGSLPALFGLSAVVPLLGTNKLLQNVINPTTGTDPFNEATALFNIAAFLVALGATRVGTDIGDHIGTDVSVATGERAVEAEVGRIVQAVGRVITIELPEEIEDIVGYDPVPDETKEDLAGTTFVFPRRLTVAELRDRLVTRLKADYAVGHVDVELADDGTVEFLAVGSRAAGIGPTLPPETSAVAVQADPAFAASAGDLVQVWSTDPYERVLTAEVRGTVDDVVTLAVDAADTRRLDAETRYKLATLPVESRPDREFASVLRAADETMAAVTVAGSSALAGQPVGALDVTVVAIRPREGPVEPLPGRDRILAGDDALYLVAAPEAIRKVEQAASPATGPAADSTVPSAEGGARVSPDERVDATTPVAGEGADGLTTEASEPSREPDEPSGVDDLSDADAPGIQALEDEVPDEAVEAEKPADAERSRDAASPGEAPATDSASDEVSVGDDSPDEGTVTDSSDAESPVEDGPAAESPDAGDSSAASPLDDMPTEESPLEDDPLEEMPAEGESPDDEPTRADLEDLAGVDVDDLTGTDVSVEANGEPDESPAESTDETDGLDGLPDADESESVGEPDESSDGTDDSADDADDTDDGGDTPAIDDERTDDDDGSGWTVAVDERRDDSDR